MIYLTAVLFNNGSCTFGIMGQWVVYCSKHKFIYECESIIIAENKPETKWSTFRQVEKVE